jgi:hypothetical protein
MHLKAKGYGKMHHMRLDQHSNQLLAIANPVMELGFTRSL